MLEVQKDRLERPIMTQEVEMEKLRNTKQIAYALSEFDYAMENYVNDRMGYSLHDLWNLKLYDVVYAGRSRQRITDINCLDKDCINE